MSDRPAKGKLQTRTLHDLSVRESGTSGRCISGYAVVWGEVDTYDTAFERGCFSSYIASKRTVLLWSHDRSMPIGKPTLTEDDRGLHLEADIAPTRAGDDALAAIKADVADGLSVGFIPNEWRERADDGVVIFTDCDLPEVSVVAIPAGESARIEEVRMATEESGVAEATTQDDGREALEARIAGLEEQIASMASESETDGDETDGDEDGERSAEVLGLLARIDDLEKREAQARMDRDRAKLAQTLPDGSFIEVTAELREAFVGDFWERASVTVLKGVRKDVEKRGAQPIVPVGTAGTNTGNMSRGELFKRAMADGKTHAEAVRIAAGGAQ